MSELVSLGQLADAGVVSIGDGYRTKQSEHGEPGYRILRVADLQNRTVHLRSDELVSVRFERAIGPKLSQPGDVLLTTKGTVGRVATYPADAETCVYSPQLCYFRIVDEGRLDRGYLAYWFRSAAFSQQASDRANNTDMAAYINLGDIRSLKLTLPPVREQLAISDVLGALDDKIAANEKSIELLLDLMLAHLQKASKGGAYPARLEEVATFHNRRRIPLSARDREARVGTVPYYGATGVFGFVDEAIFDERLVLVGEDGSVITPVGAPVVQYIWGPAWVNNHAHVLTGTTVSTELLHLMLLRSHVASLVTGAVQPKISMGNLKTLSLQLPGGSSLAAIEMLVEENSALLRALTQENRTLASTRDALLPLLMSGKVRVKDAEQAVEDSDSRAYIIADSIGENHRA